MSYDLIRPFINNRGMFFQLFLFLTNVGVVVIVVIQDAYLEDILLKLKIKIIGGSIPQRGSLVSLRPSDLGAKNSFASNPTHSNSF